MSTPITPTSKFVEVNGLRLHYLDWRRARDGAHGYPALWRVLASLPCPTLLLWGSISDGLSEAQARKIVAFAAGHVREDPDLSAHVPRLKPARVTVTLTDGRQLTRLRESARGDFQDPYGEDEFRAKLRQLAGVVLSPTGVARAEALVDRLDDLPRLGDLVVALQEDRGHQ